MSFLKKAFGSSSPRSESNDAGLDEDLVDEIVMVAGMPFPEVDESQGRTIYAKMNPAWSGKHHVTILQTSDFLMDVSEQSKCVMLCLAHKAIASESTLFMQPCVSDGPMFCLFTYARWKHRSATKDQIVILSTPIPFTTTGRPEIEKLLGKRRATPSPGGRVDQPATRVGIHEAQSAVREAAHRFFEWNGLIWDHRRWETFLRDVRVRVPVTLLTDAEVGNLLEREAATERQRGAQSVASERLARQVFINSVGMEFANIPADEFLMGAPEYEERRERCEMPQHHVTLTKPFMMATTPVTQKQWRAVMGTNPSHFNGDDLPVEEVSWDDAVVFCRRLSDREGKKYRLPTEAEWEYACRAGTKTAYHTGTGEAAMDEAGWWREMSTQPVGQKKPNAWGLYDMHGNVREWCSDYFGKYQADKVRDPAGPAQGKDRVRRGGWFAISEVSCRAASRWPGEPGERDHGTGFRLCFDEAATSSRRTR